MRIALIGKAGAGKDTIADYLVQNYDFKKFAFADKIKEIVYDLFPDAGPKPRKLLQDVGMFFRGIDKDVWVKYLCRKVEKEPGNVVVTDVRFKNELEGLRKLGFIPIKVEAAEEIRKHRLLERDGIVDYERLYHISETELDDVTCYYRVVNNGGLEQLYENIRLLCKLFPDR